MNSKEKLQVLLLRDDLPGHLSQSRGLVKWLEDRYRIEPHEASVRLKLKPLAKLLLPSIIRSHRLAPLVLKFYRGVPHDLQGFDLIVSAGGATSFLNAALGRQWQIPNVFLGSKRRLRSDDFSAHLTLESTGEPNNIVMTLPPTLVDPQQLQKQGDELRASLGLQADEKLNMLAVGGDGAGYQYDDKTAQQLARLIIEKHQDDGKRWLLTTSRRTGVKLEQELRRSIPTELLADSVWWAETPHKVMAAYMGAAERIFITADSMSMIAEAIASTKPTVVLKPEKAQPAKRYLQALQRYEQLGLCRLVELAKPLVWAPEGGTALGQVREELLERLVWQLGLPSDR